MAKTRRPLTDAERDARRAAQRELVRASIEQLRTSDGWQAYLNARRRFPSYSWRNVLLILHQRSTATRVAGFRTWLDLGYCVRKRPDDVPEGAWAIRIWARCEPSRKRIQSWRDAGGDPDERPRATYKLVNVFAQDQVQALPPPAKRRRRSRRRSPRSAATATNGWCPAWSSSAPSSATRSRSMTQDR